MSIASIQQQISTPEGFSKVVSAKRGVFIGAIVLLIVSVFCIGMNLFQLGTASDWSWNLIFRYFFDAQAVEFTGYRSGRSEMWRFIYVYLPLVALPLGIILLIVHLVTRKNAGASLFESYQSNGWVGRQVSSGLVVQNGNAKVDVVFISHPSIPEDVFQNAVAHYGVFLSGLDKKGLKDVTSNAMKSGALKGTWAATLLPGAPDGMIAAPRAGKGDFVAVIPPVPAKSDKFRVFAVKAQ